MNRYFLLTLIFVLLLGSVGCAASGDALSPEYDYPAADGSIPYGYLEFIWNEDENGYFVYERDNNPYVDIVIPESYNGQPVVGIGRHAFGAYSKVRNVVVPDSVRIIESQAFNYCDYLEGVVFSKSSGLVTIRDYAFYNCKTITSINLPKSVEEIGYRAFSTCPSIINLTVDENNRNYLSQNSTIYSKDMKTLVCVAPASYVSDDIVPDGNQSLSEIIIPDGVEIIGAGAFADCDRLESICIPDSVKSIEKGAFMGCDSLTKVSFGEGSSLSYIGDGAFRECYALVEVDIPKGVKAIERYAFYCDNALIRFNFAGSISEWKDIVKGEKWDVNTGGYLVVCIDGEITKGE